MDKNELAEILAKHKQWLNNKEGGICANLFNADLFKADLFNADLRHANLRNADLRHANLGNADLRNADLDFSVWPLWCGSFDVKVDVRIARQIAYHFCRLECDDAEYKEAKKAVIAFAYKFHRVEECSTINVK